MAQLDRVVLERLRATVGAKTFADLAREFLSDSERLAKAVEDGAAEDDPDAVRRAAHELRGLAVLFGAHDVRDACSKLERLQPTSEAAKELTELCAEARAALRRVLGGGKKRQTGVA